MIEWDDFLAKKVLGSFSKGEKGKVFRGRFHGYNGFVGAGRSKGHWSKSHGCVRVLAVSG